MPSGHHPLQKAWQYTYELWLATVHGTAGFIILSLGQQVSDHDEVWRQRRWPAAIARSVVAGSLCIMLSIGIYFRIIAPTRSGRLLAVQQSDI